MVQIFELIGEKKIINILKIFLDKPTTDFSQSEIISKTHFSKVTVMKWLTQLEKNEILCLRKRSRIKYYSLNRNNYEVIQLKKFYNSTSNIILELRKKLKVNKLILFGSYARGTDRSDSDIDILIITDEEERKIKEIVRRISKKYKKKISPVVKTAEQYISLAKKEEILWRRINSEGVIVYDSI